MPKSKMGKCFQQTLSTLCRGNAAASTHISSTNTVACLVKKSWNDLSFRNGWTRSSSAAKDLSLHFARVDQISSQHGSGSGNRDTRAKQINRHSLTGRSQQTVVDESCRNRRGRKDCADWRGSRRHFHSCAELIGTARCGRIRRIHARSLRRQTTPQSCNVQHTVASALGRGTALTIV